MRPGLVAANDVALPFTTRGAFPAAVIRLFQSVWFDPSSTTPWPPQPSMTLPSTTLKAVFARMSKAEPAVSRKRLPESGCEHSTPAAGTSATG